MSASPVAVSAKKTPPAARRKDPESREVTGLALNRQGESRHTKVVNRDPNMVYVLAAKSDEISGMPYYESMGYDVVRRSEEGPRLAAARKGAEGDVIEFRGHVLMCISKEAHKELYLYGEDGISGQALGDTIETRIRKQKRADNPFAGMKVGAGASGVPYVQEDNVRSEEPEDVTND